METRLAHRRASAHTYFLDLCKLFEHDDPVTSDPTSEWFETRAKGALLTMRDGGHSEGRALPRDWAGPSALR
jgi:hypothetical protein